MVIAMASGKSTLIDFNNLGFRYWPRHVLHFAHRLKLRRLYMATEYGL